MPPLKKMTAKTGGTYNGGSGAGNHSKEMHDQWPNNLLRNGQPKQQRILCTSMPLLFGMITLWILLTTWSLMLQTKPSLRRRTSTTQHMPKPMGFQRRLLERNLSNCFWLRSNLGLVMTLVPIVRPRLG
ncbi:unnamed protein product [Cuscuta campestris]|uniref:Uncharacterized protein n=1 Tax=Cuscuta campestris TaxID=132261 RepID=A0A484K5Q5_9ASTE|nr:unnamed protein product [Cuscuta campestris]